ncbi:efflux RND transporter permease subunit [Granulicella mallensis]|uniref:Heavy metal efflux pump, CzcA family n=1 Tax=Granulicella mallensis (strain ATCC BAA-1857 / DSM 23137 / MP5ACTX8) TaxID=682795 RepID=G8NSE4_GRAMM|nr:CusA/CzcA family heavy metal efflux RND transporter [Granulicella mallensis]AEU38520.1 heavy metal efflux pump, CzcA family [Granulicella mallensis MP5ACTX8]
MIKRVVDFALNNRFIILIAAVLLFGWGAISFHNLPVEAYPDVANNYVSIITQWPGRSAEDVEQQVTVPLEIGMAGIPHMAHLRSTTLAGISSIMMIFDDESADDWNREKVLERLSQVTLPAGLQPQIGTDWSPVGQIYWYTLKSTNPEYDDMALKGLEDWQLEKQFRSVPGVVDVSSFGGITREYQVTVDPEKLIAYGLTIAQVQQQLAANNVNTGGSFIEQGQQQINVQEVGLFTNVHDIEQTVLKASNGTALRVSDVATVAQGPKIRLGQIGKTYRSVDGKLINDGDAVEGVLLLQKGENSDATLARIHEKVKELNERILPKGVTIVPFLDRSTLLKLTTTTVLDNLTKGILLVVIILFFFLGNLRGALIVAITIPFALLFASICLDLNHIPANLLSLGALDFGMVVDGAVVMIENIVRHLSHKRQPDKTPIQIIREAAHEVQRPVFYAIAIIITTYLPIFTLQSVEGRLFKPMAWTVAFALLGALIFSMILAPVLASFLFPKGTTEWENPVMHWLTKRYRHDATWAIEHKTVPIIAGLALLGLGAFLMFSGAIGSEFLPHLDEGAIWVRGSLAPSTGPTESRTIADRARVELAAFPEVTQVVSQIGRPDDGSDTTGFFNTEYFVDLKPKDEWRPVFHKNKEELIAAMDRELEKMPGVIWNFSQPISDNVEEAVSGVKGELAVKLYGTDLKTLEHKGDEIVQVMSTVPGVADLGLFRVIGQPNLNYVIDRQAAARYGINVADIQNAIEGAVGGTLGGAPVTQVLDGEARYDVMVRYNPKFRSTPEAIGDIRLLSPSGERVSLSQLTRPAVTDGAEEIYREEGSRYVAIKYSVRHRDLGSTVEEAIAKVNKQVSLPPGYKLDWAGEYESQKRSSRRLMLVLPITVLVIFMILYAMFGSFKWAMLVICNVMIAPVGGMVALYLTHTHFSVSSGVGFLALFGVSVQTGIIMLEYINQMRVNGHPVEEAAVEGAVLRLRPIVMTMLVAMLGLLPAALSHGIGSDSQRPFAIVIVGGLMGALLFGIFILPCLYVWLARSTDILPRPDYEFEN